jgi:hypothetical protein
MRVTTSSAPRRLAVSPSSLAVDDGERAVRPSRDDPPSAAAGSPAPDEFRTDSAARRCSDRLAALLLPAGLTPAASLSS